MWMLLLVLLSVGIASCGSTDATKNECAEECGGECVSPCPDWLSRDTESCECEPGCGRGYEWVDDACVPIGGDSDSDTDTDSDIECTDARDCEGIAHIKCNPRCEAGRCSYDPCPNDYCGDEDGDGWGAGPYCRGPDCDDTDPGVSQEATRPCYSGPEGTVDVGPCVGGTQSCAEGVWGGICASEVIPAAETCDGVDEDCDGVVDQDGADCAEQLGDPPCGAWECNAAACESSCE